MFSFDNAHYLGTAVLTLLGLLGGYVLLLRIREYYRESPDPKLTYASRADHEKLRQQLAEATRDHRQDLERVRCEHRAGEARLSRTLTEHRGELSGALAQQTLFNQRLVELSTKVDRFIERSFKP